MAVRFGDSREWVLLEFSIKGQAGELPGKEIIMLQYSVLEEILWGTVGRKSFSMRAFSGGGRGSTGGLERTDLAHWSSRKKAPDDYDETDRGGPIPPGFYVATHIGKYKHYRVCARLEQTISSLLQFDPFSDSGLRVTDRDSFFIHGTGVKGSDGCIVPGTAKDLDNLMLALKEAGPTSVEVYGDGINGDRLLGVRSNVA